MTTETSFSVVIPCYNYAHYLKGCVESILCQGVKVQVIVIDDCSTDETPAVGISLANDPRVTFIRHETNQGHIKTYNEGLALATGDYTALISADDLLTPGALRRARAVFDAHPEVGMVYGHAPYFQSNDNLPKARIGKPRVDIWDGRNWIVQRCKSATSCISSPEVVVRTSLQRQLGGYCADLPHAGDLEMWLRFAAYSSIAYLAEVDQAYYRRHNASMQSTRFNSVLADLRERRAAFEAVFNAHGHKIEDMERLREIALRALAKEALWRACWSFDRRRVDQAFVDDLETFAKETYPGARSLTEYRGLQWRRRLGTRWPPILQPILPSGYIHWVKRKMLWRRHRLRGV
jgi:glycosyltransferase involved in cell wall biosynthesis